MARGIGQWPGAVGDRCRGAAGDPFTVMFPSHSRMPFSQPSTLCFQVTCATQGRFVLSGGRTLEVRHILHKYRALRTHIIVNLASFASGCFVHSSDSDHCTCSDKRLCALLGMLQMRHQPENGEHQGGQDIMTTTQLLTDPEGAAIRRRDAEPIEDPFWRTQRRRKSRSCGRPTRAIRALNLNHSKSRF